MLILLSDVCISVFVFVYVYLTFKTGADCKRFAADWTAKRIEHSTELKFPVSSGATISVRCADGFQKLSGPDAVTCSEGKLDGLDDIHCSESG